MSVGSFILKNNQVCFWIGHVLITKHRDLPVCNQGANSSYRAACRPLRPTRAFSEVLPVCSGALILFSWLLFIAHPKNQHNATNCAAVGIWVQRNHRRVLVAAVERCLPPQVIMLRATLRPQAEHFASTGCRGLFRCFLCCSSLLA